MCWLFTHSMCVHKYIYIYMCVCVCMCVCYNVWSLCARNRSAEDDHPTAWWPAGRKQFKIVEAPKGNFGFAIYIYIYTHPFTFPYIYWHLMTSLYIALPCFLMFSCCACSGPARGVRAPNPAPNWAPKEAFEPQKSSWQVRICSRSLSLSLPLSLSIFLFPFYVSVHIHLYTSLDLVFSCSLVLPLRAPKAEFGPRIGPRKRRSGPERQLTSSDLLSLSLSLSLSFSIYLYI